MNQAEIHQAFATFGVNPIERDVRELRELMHGTKASGDTVYYRTVLTNGTGNLKHRRTEAENAELERDAS